METLVKKKKAEEVFENYVEIICKFRGIKRSDLLKRSKLPHLVEARQLLYYLCYEKMRKIDIYYLMEKNGYNRPDSSVNNGIEKMELTLQNDEDYKKIIDQIKLF